MIHATFTSYPIFPNALSANIFRQFTQPRRIKALFKLHHSLEIQFKIQRIQSLCGNTSSKGYEELLYFIQSFGMNFGG